MNTEPFVIEQTYNAPVSKVWKAITDKDDMKQWYFNLAEFKPELDLNLLLPAAKMEGNTNISVK